jgi:hypothetical protein
MLRRAWSSPGRTKPEPTARTAAAGGPGNGGSRLPLSHHDLTRPVLAARKSNKSAKADGAVLCRVLTHWPVAGGRWPVAGGRWAVGGVAGWRWAVWPVGGVAVGGVAVWRCGGVAVRRCGGVAVRRCGGAAVWRCGGAAVWRCGGAAVRRCGGAAVGQWGGDCGAVNWLRGAVGVVGWRVCRCSIVSVLFRGLPGSARSPTAVTAGGRSAGVGPIGTRRGRGRPAPSGLTRLQDPLQLVG